MSLTDEHANENNELKELDSNTFQKIHEKAEKIGYADGVAAGNDSVFQSGFDKGYADGLYTGLNFEKYRSFFETISNSKNAPQSLTKEKILYASLTLPEATKAEHFQYTKLQNETIDEISKQQKIYVDKQLQEFAEKLPNTSDIFS